MCEEFVPRRALALPAPVFLEFKPQSSALGSLHKEADGNTLCHAQMEPRNNQWEMMSAGVHLKSCLSGQSLTAMDM